MVRRGRVEILSTDFALGWAERSGSEASIVYATLDGRIIGFSEANIQRPDLSAAASASGLAAGAFVIVYKRAVPQERATDVLIWSLGEAEPIVQAKVLRIDPAPKLQVIILGSPRSGT